MPLRRLENELSKQGVILARDVDALSSYIDNAVAMGDFPPDSPYVVEIRDDVARIREAIVMIEKTRLTLKALVADKVVLTDKNSN